MNSVTHLKLYDIASRPVLTVAPDTPLEDVIGCFAERHMSSLVVVENDLPVGIVTERDLVRLMCVGAADQRPVREVMSTPLMTVPHDLDFSTAQVLMSNSGIRHLVLVDTDGRLCGLASETDFRRHLGSDLLSLIQNLGTVIDQGGKLIAPDQPLSVALETMAACKLDHVIVGDAGCAQGILTERDVPSLLARHVDPQRVTLGEVMSHPLSTIGIDTSINEAAGMMERSGYRHLVVQGADGRFIGVVSQHRMLEKLGVALMGQSRVELEDRLSMILEATGIGTWEFDNQRRQLIRSSALNGMVSSSSRATSEPLESLLGRVEAESRPAFRAAFDALESGASELFSVDCRIQGEDGQWRWVSSRGKVVERDHDGHPVRSAGVAIDISAQKLSEENRRQSEARFRKVVENIPLAIGHINAQEDVVFINAHFEALFGYTRDDLPTFSDWLERAYPDPAYRQEVRARWDDKADFSPDSPGTLNPFEYRVTCKDGGERVIEISGINIGDDFLAIFIDVTERRMQQELLEFSNAILERISRDSGLPDILEYVVRRIESLEAGTFGSVLLLDESGKKLRDGAAPSLPAAYSALVNGIEIGPLVGSCGTSAYLGQPVFVGDIANDPHWAEYREIAASHGLAACWSSPIMSITGRVLGTFGVYWPDVRTEVGVRVMRYVEAATTLAAIAIENAQRETELQHRIDELRRWQQATLGREGRVMELKREVNDLSARLGEAPRYASVLDGGAVP